MTSKLTLYHRSLLHPGRNFALDDLSGNRTIETYLSTLQKSEAEGFQYIKHGLNVAIKIDSSQAGLEMSDSKDVNYAKVQNGDERPIYYFVVGKTWKSGNTIELRLQMDTLNTLKYNDDYIIDPKTLVQRQHRDRFWKMYSVLASRSDYVGTQPVRDSSLDPFKADALFSNGSESKTISNVSCVFNENLGDDPSSWGFRILAIPESDSKWIGSNSGSSDWRIMSFTADGMTYDFDYPIPLSRLETSYRIIRKIHLRSEDISAPVYMAKESQLLKKDSPDIGWSLYYKNSDNQASSPVDCFLIPSEPLTINIQQNSGELNPTNVPSDKWIVFYSTYPSGKLRFRCGDSVYGVSDSQGPDGNTRTIFAIHNDSGTLKSYYIGVYTTPYTGQEVYGEWTKVYEGNVIVENPPESIFAYQRDTRPNDKNALMNEYFRPGYATLEIQMGAYIQSVIYDGGAIDKTLQENLKIINLPYSPTDYSIVAGVATFASCWTYNTTEGKVKLTDFSYRFTHRVETEADSPLKDYDPGISAINPNVTRHVRDSKLFHSDYHRPKFVYDSFGRMFPLEQIDYARTIPYSEDGFSFDFIMSRNIVSKFMFRFNFEYMHANEDYPNIVAVARNNEEVIYNSSYLNYVRTGYNYDLKSKERQEAASVAGIGVNMAAFLASIAVGAATSNPIAIGAGIASGFGFVSQIMNHAKTAAQNEENIQKKLNEANRQAVSVMNADDYDLLYEYTRNRAKICTYDVSDEMSRILDDLFYYGGYISNEQMVPDISTRYWFNYVQATLVLDDSSNVPEDIEDDIKARFSEGVTFMHCHDGNFDLRQEKENWETSLL